jgi:hypothetical protein
MVVVRGASLSSDILRLQYRASGRSSRASIERNDGGDDAGARRPVEFRFTVWDGQNVGGFAEGGFVFPMFFGVDSNYKRITSPMDVSGHESTIVADMKISAGVDAGHERDSLKPSLAAIGLGLEDGAEGFTGCAGYGFFMQGFEGVDFAGWVWLARVEEDPEEASDATDSVFEVLVFASLDALLVGWFIRGVFGDNDHAHERDGEFFGE